MVTKEGKPGQLVYGESTSSLALIDELYKFYIINPLTQNSCKLEIEVYWKVRSLIKKLIAIIVAKKVLSKNIRRSLDDLMHFVKKGLT